MNYVKKSIIIICICMNIYNQSFIFKFIEIHQRMNSINQNSHIWNRIYKKNIIQRIMIVVIISKYKRIDIDSSTWRMNMK
jgi:hypothetical protein